MRENNWAEVDTFIADLFVNPDPALDAALAESEKAGCRRSRFRRPPASS